MLMDKREDKGPAEREGLHLLYKSAASPGLLCAAPAAAAAACSAAPSAAAPHRSDEPHRHCPGSLPNSTVVSFFFVYDVLSTACKMLQGPH